MRSWLGWVVCAACGCHGHAAARQTATVREGDVVERVVLTGVVHPTNALEIKLPQTDESSLVVRWIVPNGTVVKTGDRVLELDDSPFTGRLRDDRTALASAEAQFKLGQRQHLLSLGEKRTEVRQHEIARDKAKLYADLPADLDTPRTARGHQLQLLQADDNVRKADKELAMAAAQATIEEHIKQLELERSRRSIAATEAALASLVVTAPRDGVVLVGDLVGSARRIHAGDTVWREQSILTFPDLTEAMDVRAQLSDVDDGRVDLHMPAHCTLDAYPRDPIDCTVTALAPVARTADGHSSLRRAFPITLVLAHGDPARFLPGMSVKIELARPAVHGLVVPRVAVAADRVQLASGEIRDVAPVQCDAQRCVVDKGVAAGDQVVIGGAR